MIITSTQTFSQSYMAPPYPGQLSTVKNILFDEFKATISKGYDFALFISFFVNASQSSKG